jgi:hypothetical protein
MNLRILKKLSKRAAPLLPLLGDDRDQFAAEHLESYTSVRGHDFKHWVRTRSVHPDPFPGTIKYKPKHGRSWVALREPSSPLKGTLMVGSMSGYYEPEWEEQTAWEALQFIVFNYFTTWNENGCVLLRKLDTTTQIFQAAQDILSGHAPMPD